VPKGSTLVISKWQAWQGRAHPALSKGIIHSLCSDPSIPFQTPSAFFRKTPSKNHPPPQTPPTCPYNLPPRHPTRAPTMPPHQHPQQRGSGSATQPATHGSQTILQTNAGPSAPSGTLRLRAEPQERRGIRWAEDVVDNEGMGKKSSKVCCIYHAPHEPGDSDSDSSSSESESDSDSEPDLSRARKAGGRGRKGKHEGHEHGHGDGDGDCSGKGNGKGKERKPSPNAYERQPKHKSKNAG
jgi:protein phosphatase 1 regulatory subunit 11